MKRVQKTVRAIAPALASMLPLGSAFASSASNVTVVELQLAKIHPNIVFIRLSAPPVDKPGCSIHNWAYTLNLATPFDEKIYATLLAALASGAPVNASGTGLCTDHGQVEAINAVAILAP